MTFLRRHLLTNPILLREMELRASRDEAYRLFNYSGPGLFLLVCGGPFLFGLLITRCFGAPLPEEVGPWSATLFMVTAWLLVLYFSHSAARFCAGSLVLEKERGTLDALRLLPRSAVDLFLGKFLAAVAPLLVEAGLTLPLLAPYVTSGAVSWPVVLGMPLLATGLVVFFGLWGMFWSLLSRDVLSAMSRSFCTVLAWNAAPLAGASLGTLLEAAGSWATLLMALAQVSPVYLVTTWLLPMPAPLERPLMLPVTLLLACMVLLGVGLVLLRWSLERLRRG